MKQVKLAAAVETEKNVPKDDLYVNLTIYDIPASLIKEFAEAVVKPCYPGGISPAIKDLMWKAVEKYKGAAKILT